MEGRSRGERPNFAARGGGLPYTPAMALTRFLSEAFAELKKVEWPTRDQLVRGVITVILVCIIVGAFLYAADIASRHIVHFLIK